MTRNTVGVIRDELVRKYKEGDFRILYNGTVKTVEIQNANFVCNEDYILRPVNEDYAKREIAWYDSESLNVKDIEGKTPAAWVSSADPLGYINSNYGWCIYSVANGKQYEHCLNTLLKDPFSRQAVMIYNRPSMQEDATANGKHDFMCTYSVQVFLNKKEIQGSLEHPYVYELKYIVYMRSNDAVFGFNNDLYWHKTVQERLRKDLEENMKYPVVAAPIEWNAASLHVYERHFKYLEELANGN